MNHHYNIALEVARYGFGVCILLAFALFWFAVEQDLSRAAVLGQLRRARARRRAMEVQ